MPDDTNKPVHETILFDGERCDTHHAGSFPIHLDRRGHAVTVGEPGRQRLPDEVDLRLLVKTGRAVPVPGEAPVVGPVIRGLRRPLPGTGSLAAGSRRPAAAAGRRATVEVAARAKEARTAADDALTMAAFFRLTDDGTDDLEAYEIYLRSYVGIRRRNAGVDVPIAMPCRFRDRVGRVAAELERMGVEDGATPTIH